MQKCWYLVYSVQIKFFSCCRKSPYPPEGALTPAGWRSHERLPSWCCGSDRSPPLCSPHTGRWRGCSERPPAEPGERRRRRRRRRRRKAKKKKNRQDRMTGRRKSKKNRHEGDKKGMRERRRDRETHLSISTHSVHPVGLRVRRATEKSGHKTRFIFQYCIMCFSACAAGSAVTCKAESEAIIHSTYTATIYRQKNKTLVSLVEIIIGLRL